MEAESSLLWCFFREKAIRHQLQVSMLEKRIAALEEVTLHVTGTTRLRMVHRANCQWICSVGRRIAPCARHSPHCAISATVVASTSPRVL